MILDPDHQHHDKGEIDAIEKERRIDSSAIGRSQSGHWRGCLVIIKIKMININMTWQPGDALPRLPLWMQRRLVGAIASQVFPSLSLSSFIWICFRIKENPKAFVVPIIDVIDDKTLEYYHGNGNYFQVFPGNPQKWLLLIFQVGGFTWSGHFTWVDIPPSELARRGSPIAPTR